MYMHVYIYTCIYMYINQITSGANMYMYYYRSINTLYSYAGLTGSPDDPGSPFRPAEPAGPYNECVMYMYMYMYMYNAVKYTYNIK